MDHSVSYKAFLDKGNNEGYEVRRFGIAQDVAANFTYLKDKIRSMFPALKAAQFFIYWKDNEGDTVAVGSDEELVIALSMMCDEKIIKLYLTRQTNNFSEPKTLKTEERIHHFGVICDNCDGSVVGFRYKCMECPDYDLCALCEGKSAHPEHVMLRIPKPQAIDVDVHRSFNRASKKWMKALHKIGSPKHYHQRVGGGEGRECPVQKMMRGQQGWAQNLTGVVSSLVDLANANLAKVQTIGAPGIDLNTVYGIQTAATEMASAQPNDGARRPASETTQAESKKEKEEPAKTVKENKQNIGFFSEAKGSEQGELISKPKLSPDVESVPKIRKQSTEPKATPSPLKSQEEPETDKKQTKNSPQKPEGFSFQQLQAILQNLENCKPVLGEEAPNPAISSPKPGAFSFQQLQAILDNFKPVLGEGAAVHTPNPETYFEEQCKILRDCFSQMTNVSAATSSQTSQPAGNSGDGNKTKPESRTDFGDNDGIRVSAVPGSEELSGTGDRSSVCSVSSQEAEDGWTYFTEIKPGQSTGAIPKKATSPSPPPPSPPTAEQAKPKTPEPTPTAPPRLHEHLSPKVVDSLNMMLAMGFSNEGGWLEKLLTDRNGDVQEVLELLMPVGPRK